MTEMTPGRSARRARGLALVLALGAVSFACRSPWRDTGARARLDGGNGASSQPAPAAPASVRLRVGSAAADDATLSIALHPPEEYDGWTREQVYALRRERVKLNASLVRDYAPADAVFGLIEDGRPWWGLDGQFCLGRGEVSIEGPSEESRFVGNPFLLLGVEEGKGFHTTNPRCRPVFPQPTSLRWDAHAAVATVTYDYSSFLKGKAEVGLMKHLDCVDLESYNARDMGFAFARLDVPASANIAPCAGSGGVVALRRFIHKGGSCGYPGGCNNASPDSPGLRFAVKAVPATAICRLWQARPISPEVAADFTFTVDLE
jgi:hypothetical protein